MSYLVARANKVFDSQPPPEDAQALSVNGSSWLWAVTAIFLFSFLILLALTLRPRYGERVFHYIFSTTILVGAIAYYTMAADKAWLVIPQANNIDNGDRQMFWAKFVYWVVSFPACVLSLGLVSGVTWASITYGVLFSWVWVIAYLGSAATPTNYKWGYYTIGTVAWLILVLGSFTIGRTSAARLGVSGHYMLLAGWVNLIWLLYPIAFGISDGGNVIGITQSFIFYGILDILLIPVLAFATIGLSYQWDYAKMGLHFTRSGRGFEGPYDEKAAAPAPTNGTNGAEV